MFFFDPAFFQVPAISFQRCKYIYPWYGLLYLQFGVHFLCKAYFFMATLLKLSNFKVKWPPTRGSKGPFESSGWWFEKTHVFMFYPYCMGMLWLSIRTFFAKMFQCLFCNDFLRKQWRRNVAVASLGQEASKQQPATPGPVKDACWDRMVKTSKVCSFQRDLSIYESKCMYTMDMNEPMCEVSNDKWTLNHWKCEKKVTSTPGDELSRSQPQTTSNTRSQPWPPHQLCKSHTPW